MSTRLDLATLDLKDALDLAVLIEVEAYQRYKMFAAQLGRRFTGDAASVFASMAENEAKHGRELETRRRALFGDAPRRVSLNDLFDVEAPDVGAPRASMSARQAFEVALSSQQKAYDFYDRALEHGSRGSRPVHRVAGRRDRARAHDPRGHRQAAPGRRHRAGAGPRRAPGAVAWALPCRTVAAAFLGAIVQQEEIVRLGTRPRHRWRRLGVRPASGDGG